MITLLTRHPFLNWEEAYAYSKATPDDRTYGAADLLFTGVQSCGGLTHWAPTQVKPPNPPLDLLWFYQTVSDIMKHWDTPQMPKQSRLALLKDVRFPPVDIEHAKDYLKFASFLSQAPGSQNVDQGFCCWLFAESILKGGHLPGVLDGTIGESYRKFDTDDDYWYSLWT